jgi:hypothetical protein
MNSVHAPAPRRGRPRKSDVVGSSSQ